VDIDAADRALAEENKWRAQRYEVGASFIDRASQTAQRIDVVLADLLATLRPDAEAPDCAEEMQHARTIVKRGSSANEQVGIYQRERKSGHSRIEAVKEVMDALVLAPAEPYPREPDAPLPNLPSSQHH
jgi:glutamate---cysteine ligase / carboxylate-amine ligase